VKAILASLSGLTGDRSVLESSLSLAQRFGATVECLHVRLDEQSALAMGKYGLLEEIEREQTQRSQSARREYEEACKRHGISAGDARAGRFKWRELTGVDAITTSRVGRLFDLVVAARHPEIPARLAEIVMRTGRPILVTAPKPAAVIGKAIAVAWKDGPESARAIAAAMPLLAKAERIALVSVIEEPAMAELCRSQLEALKATLSLDGAQVQIDCRPALANATDTLRSAAYDADCDLLVMGAYGHSRLREYVFGGVTKDILADCALPVLMFH
jgi:nucleotide-binding universal stress UspA family protein